MSRGGHKPKTGWFKPCKICGTNFWVLPSDGDHRLYCSIACCNKGHTTGVNAGSVQKVCDYCGEGYTDYPCRPSRFCSQSCYWAMKSSEFGGQSNHRWRGGHGKYRGPSWSSQRRKALIRDGYRCQKCGLPALHVHHVIRYGDCVDHIDANRLQNLLTVCSKCHKASSGIECLYQEWKRLGYDREEIQRRTELWIRCR